MQKKRQSTPKIAESRELLRSIIRFMKLNQQLELQELIGLYTAISPEETIPVSIFAHGLSPSEALCKYLKENCSLSFHDIAVLLNRDDRSVWTSYSRASSKSGEPLESAEDDLLIPVAVFQDRSRSILEHVVHYLRNNYNLSNSRIAKLTNKNPSAIATVARRAELKQEGGVKNG
ncbi:hypothetical protein KY363_04400 [Candidatus Woesearchaeota archaeon]|nr:hypothetical protein [Candidatus Woesearchaeota archaeon]